MGKFSLVPLLRSVNKCNKAANFFSAYIEEFVIHKIYDSSYKYSKFLGFFLSSKLGNISSTYCVHSCRSEMSLKYTHCVRSL
jgi:hypothetical protein